MLAELEVAREDVGNSAGESGLPVRETPGLLLPERGPSGVVVPAVSWDCGTTSGELQREIAGSDTSSSAADARAAAAAVETALDWAGAEAVSAASATPAVSAVMAGTAASAAAAAVGSKTLRRSATSVPWDAGRHHPFSRMKQGAAHITSKTCIAAPKRQAAEGCLHTRKRFLRRLLLAGLVGEDGGSSSDAARRSGAAIGAGVAGCPPAAADAAAAACCVVALARLPGGGWAAAAGSAAAAADLRRKAGDRSEVAVVEATPRLVLGLRCSGATGMEPVAKRFTGGSGGSCPELAARRVIFEASACDHFEEESNMWLKPVMLLTSRLERL